jgi:glycine oxidase
MSLEDREIGIIGAGAIGLGVGWVLARRGASVTIFERNEPGSGASRASAGMLAPVAELEFGERELFELGMRSLELYPKFVDQLESQSGRSVDYRDDGTLVVAVDRDDAEALDHIHEYHEQLGLGAERLNGEEARELEPGLAPSTHGGLMCRTDHQIDPERLVDAMVDGFRAAGGKLRTDTPVNAVDLDGVHPRIAPVEDPPEAFDTVVVCAGVWSNDIEGLPDDTLPHLRPVRGQMIAIDLGAPPICEYVLRVPDPSQLDVYLAPKSRGRLLVGATAEERGFDPHLTAGGVFELLRGAWDALPGIYDQDLLDMWTGFRPTTLDEKPVIGPTETDGLWVAVGHGRGGILQTPITAHSIAEAMETGRIPPAIEDFTPAS